MERVGEEGNTRSTERNGQQQEQRDAHVDLFLLGNGALLESESFFCIVGLFFGFEVYGSPLSAMGGCSALL